jgi:hypothetical protein
MAPPVAQTPRSTLVRLSSSFRNNDNDDSSRSVEFIQAKANKADIEKQEYMAQLVERQRQRRPHYGVEVASTTWDPMRLLRIAVWCLLLVGGLVGTVVTGKTDSGLQQYVGSSVALVMAMGGALLVEFRMLRDDENQSKDEILFQQEIENPMLKGGSAGFFAVSENEKEKDNDGDDISNDKAP